MKRKIICGFVLITMILGKATIANACGGGYLKIDDSMTADGLFKVNVNTNTDESYSSGQYKVGIDIQAGEYVVFASGGSGYFCVSSDSNGEDIIQNANFDYNSIISISDGQYFELVRCYAVPIGDVEKLELSGTGMFKVGTHLSAGEYKLVADGKGYYCIYDSSTQQNIVSNNNFERNQYVTVSEGQYLELVRCHFETVPIAPQVIITDVNKVRKVQEQLNALSYNCGTPDGIAGAKTAEAVKKYKINNGLGTDENITFDLIEHLEKNSN